MGGKKAPQGGNRTEATQATKATPVERSESLRATEEERLATSKSLYGDFKARISSNSHNIHDRMRIRAYTNLINAAMKGKRVLHIGCGMGLFSMIAARCAASVVAIDTSAIVQSARVVAADNRSHNLTFLQGSLSQGTVTLPPEQQQFDVIFCEWMSSFLTNDMATVKEVIYCRQNFLAPGGLICPSEATLSVAAINDYQYKCETVDYWDNVYGFNMAPMQPLVMREPTACSIPQHLVKTSLAPITTIRISDLESNNLSFDGGFAIVASAKSTLHFLTFYVSATHRDTKNPAANFTLASEIAAANPWTEVSAALPEPLPVFPGDVITGTVHVNPLSGDTEIKIALQFKNNLIEHQSETVHHFQY